MNHNHESDRLNRLPFFALANAMSHNPSAKINLLKGYFRSPDS